MSWFTHTHTHGRSRLSPHGQHRPRTNTLCMCPALVQCTWHIISAAQHQHNTSQAHHITSASHDQHITSPIHFTFSTSHQKKCTPHHQHNLPRVLPPRAPREGIALVWQQVLPHRRTLEVGHITATQRRGRDHLVSRGAHDHLHGRVAAAGNNPGHLTAQGLNPAAHTPVRCHTASWEREQLVRSVGVRVGISLKYV